MIAFLSGILDSTTSEYAVIDVGGIGYKVFMPTAHLFSIGRAGSSIKLYTHMQVREDAMDLYGFPTQEERSSFEMLLSVSGVGPKAALSVLSTLTPSQFALAVASNDAKAISAAHGVGLKISQRIILELKDKVSKSFGEQDMQNINIPSSGGNMHQEALGALAVLGYSPSEAKKAVSASDGDSVEEIIKNALKLLM